MFPDGDSMDKNKLSGESIDVKYSAPPETVESPVAAIEVIKEDKISVCHPRAAETVPSSTMDESSNETAKTNSLDEPATQDQSDLAGSKNSHMELPDSSISQMRLNTTKPSLAKNELDAEKSSCFSCNFHVLSEQNLENGLKQPKQQMTNLFERKPEMVTAGESQMTQQHMIKEPRNNVGLALWPGLSSTVPLAAGSPGSSQSSASKIPAWLDAAMYGPRTCSLKSGSSTKKVSKVTMDKKSMKRCITHVYISCLIRNLQMQDIKESNLQQPLQLKPLVRLNQTALLYPNNCSKFGNGKSRSSSGSSATDRNPYEARSGILRQMMLHHHQEEAHVASASGMHISQRQSFDFLSLSAGGITMEANNSSKKVRNVIESLQQHQVPYLHSLPQHQSLGPFSFPLSRYSSSAYTNQLSTATAAQQVQLQLPQSLSNPCCGPPYTSNSGVAKQQQQQRFWAAHLAAQSRPGGISAVLTQFPSWENRRSEWTCAETDINQQPKVAVPSSLLPARVKRADHHLPSIYEEGNGGFRGGGPLPLQLLCNERL
ncbi:hypothetical protein DITRI_Ditri03aG0215300 [Diplodiscus trichospermus]